MGPLMSLVAPLLVTAFASSAELQPVAPWSVDYASNMCVLSRGFGGKAEQPAMTLALRPLPLSTRAEVIVATATEGTATAKRGKVTLTLLPSGQQRQEPFERRRNETLKRSLISFDVPIEFLESMRNTEALEMTIGAEAPVRLGTGSTAKALAALTPCQDDLLKTWGYDPTLKEKIATPATPVGKSYATFFGRDYYPREALALGQEGRVAVAWTVNADGKARDCRVLDSSGAKSLDLTTCAILLQKVRFKPAVDRAGLPLTSYQTLAVRWTID